MYYHVCPNCSSHLDPDERCDCKTKNETSPLQRDRSLTNVSKVSLSTPNFNVKQVRGCLNA